MAAPSIDQLFKDTGTVKKQPKTAQTITPTYQPSQKDQILTVPGYREHLQSLRDNRATLSSQDLLKQMFKQDPDVSATVGSFLTLSDTEMTMLVRDADGNIDTTATTQLPKLVRALFASTTYLEGFQLKPGLRMFCQEMRYLLMLRGAVGNELVFDQKLVPSRLQHVDMASIEWFEKNPNEYKPRQKVQGKNEGVVLDIPSFFVSFHRRDPTSIYANSDFVSVINTAAARTQVINDLYRIMQITGFPRIDIKVLEETLNENAPAEIRQDPQKLRAWASDRLNDVAANFAELRSDQSFVHMDSIEASILNDKNPGAGLDITSVIEVLNAQNQAALKTMATVIGRGTGAAGVASVEARIAAMNADQLNVPIAEQLSKALTFLINVFGIQGFVEVNFAPAELRPSLELEPQKTLRATRLRQDLSDGLITDVEYHLMVYNRLPQAGTPELSGTGFMTPVDTTNAGNVTPNSDPLGASQAPSGGKMAKSNGKLGSKKPAKSNTAVKAALALLSSEEEE
ncbi:hypothetical protein CPT_Seuss9 [Caulobacter phage Seuss]|uniref:Portal protein n=1 Tax=Caulobacter phage Seuss TaxID=1675601 RepID=A0A0K1LN24_9CAUD|nr:portal protein [Caulobacter phage Seuss]AKU43535.1 hypothetical protein CPT_Seuss9 [Caulobacter phage Seuss]